MPTDTNRLGSLVTPEFLAAIKEVYPLKPLNIHSTDRLIWFEAGQYSVIEFLQAKYDLANNNPLNQRHLP